MNNIEKVSIALDVLHPQESANFYVDVFDFVIREKIDDPLILENNVSILVLNKKELLTKSHFSFTVKNQKIVVEKMKKYKDKIVTPFDSAKPEFVIEDIDGNSICVYQA